MTKPDPLSKFPSLSTMSSTEAKDVLWRRGTLHWKLDSSQKQLYNKFKRTDNKIVVWNCSRQIGKSYSLVILALEYCISNSNVQVKYCAGQAKSVIKIIKPTIRKLLEECPKDIRPKWNREGGVYTFPNGSLLYVEAIDGDKADDLRGTPAHLCIVDEAGFVKNLNYAIHSVLMPMTSTTKGRIIVVSTPPKSADHDLRDIIKDAEFDGAYIKKDIYTYLKDVENDPPQFRDRLTADEVEKIRKVTKLNDWEREYLCKLVVDMEAAVIPEMDQGLVDRIVKDWDRPKFFDNYVAMDLGTKDLTAVVFGYFDFLNNKLIIEDEFSCNGQKVTTTYLSKNIKEIEERLWTQKTTGLIKYPHKRIADDNEVIARQELGSVHNLLFLPTKKDGKGAALHDLRNRLGTGQIIIHPRCKTLIFHLRNATWNNRRTSYDRSSDGGHYDFVDAMSYLIRNIDWRRNPYPQDYNWPDKYVKFKDTDNLGGAAQTIKNLFVKKKK